MTNKKQQAFPAPAGVAHITEQGMTLLDYFAAHAMSGLLAANWCASVRDSSGDIGNKMLTTDAYTIAYAMMKERET